MRRAAAGVLVLCLLAVPNAVSAADLSGTGCKAGAKQKRLSSITYVCVKQRGKWTWQKQALTPATRSAAAVDLSQDKRIALAADLAPIEQCKAIDVTPQPHNSQGFPRPDNALPGMGTYRLLVLPFSTSDYTFTPGDLDRLKQAIETTRAFYTRVSYGQSDLQVRYASPDQWVRLSGTANQYNLINRAPQQHNEALLREIIAGAPATVNFDEYDGVIVESPLFGGLGGGEGFIGETFTAKTGVAKRINLHFGPAVQKSATIRHELGHTLFGLEDLYVFLNATRPSVPDPLPFKGWDIMSSGDAADADFSGWNKFLIGWLSDSQVRCVRPEAPASVHFLGLLGSRDASPKLLLVPLEAGVTLAVEARTSSRPTVGALVYLIDSRIQHGDGPISAPGSLHGNGEVTFVAGVRLQVLATSDAGVLVQLFPRT